MAINPIKPGADGENGSAKALGVIDAYTKIMIALAVGVVALSAVFLGNFYRGHDVWSVELAWIFCGFSTFAGILARAAHISQLVAAGVRKRRDTLELLSMLQWLTLIVGLVFLGTAVIANVNASPTVLGLTTRAPMAVGASNVQLACRTGDSSGCSLQVSVSTLTGPLTTGPTVVAEVPSDVTRTVHVVLPRPLVLAVRLHGQATGAVMVVASGGTGGSSTTVLDVQFTKSTPVGANGHPAKKKNKKKKKKKKKHRRRAGATGASGLTPFGTTGVT